MNFVAKKFLFLGYEGGMRIGICVPSSCTKNEVRQMIKLAGSQLGVNAEIDSCEVKEGFKMDKTQITILAILSSFILVCLLSTIIIEVKAYHDGKSAYDHKKKSYAYRVLLAFSIVANFKNLMRTRPSENRSLDCMNGIRYLSCTWVVLGHCYMFYDVRMFREMNHIEEMMKDVFLPAISNAFLSVESFLFVTSTLLSYVVVTKYDSTKTYHPIITILRRVWRILPGVILITSFVFLMPFITSGPDYKEYVDAHIENCQKYWWANIIYIGNFIPANDMCNGHTWYISVDMQLFVVGIFYFLILFRKKIYGKIFLVICLAISTIATGTVTYIMKYPPTSLVRYTDIKFWIEYSGKVHMQAHPHLGVYTVGLFLGTYLARNPKVKLSRWTCFVGWIVAICSALVNMYAVYPWNYRGGFTMVEAIVYSATNRTVWGACLAWLVLACYAGKAGYVNKIMCWPGFQPLVKISYLVFLVHYLVIIAFCFSRQGPQDFTHSTHVFNFFGILCTSHILAVFLRLIYEAPCIEVERLFCSWLFSKPSKDSNEKPTLNTIKLEERSEYQLENGGDKHTMEDGHGNINYRL